MALLNPFKKFAALRTLRAASTFVSRQGWRPQKWGRGKQECSRYVAVGCTRTGYTRMPEVFQAVG